MNYKVLGTFLFLLAATVGWLALRHTQVFEKDRQPAYADLENALVTFEYIHELKTKHQLRKISDLLPLLPKVFRSRHVLMFKSRSLQEGSYLNPRVLMFTHDAKFVMSFNGLPSQKGFGALETMRFVDGEERFIFEEIIFEDDTAARLEYLTNSKDTKAIIAEFSRPQDRKGPNPLLCSACHRRLDPRPNWDHYNFWPGAYGQFDNFPQKTDFSYLQQHQYFHDPVTGIKIEPNNDEPAKMLPVFISNWEDKLNKRYEHLVDVQNNIGTGRHINEKSINGINSVFTGAIFNLNFRRVLRMLMDSPSYKKYKYLAFAAAANCSKNNIKEHLSIMQIKLNDKKLEKYFNIKGQKRSLLHDDFYVKRIEMVFDLMNLHGKDIYTNFQYGPGNRFATPGINQRELLFQWSQMDNDLSPYVFNSKHKTTGYYLPQAILTSGSCEKFLKLTKQVNAN